MDHTAFSCIIPTLADDYNDISQHLYLLLDMLPIKKLVFIGSEELESAIYNGSSETGNKSRIDFINENELLSFADIKHAYENRLSEIASINGTPKRFSRTGWYYQQFLKMEYWKLCTDDYYLCWDADTIPLHKIEMFHSIGKPFLDTKSEYTHSYFETIKNLWGFDKAIEQSFISEHMLFNKLLMKEMIEEIESMPLSGSTYYEKIFSAVTDPFKGFSEFETYGTWIANKYPNEYRLRQWKSIRNTNFMINRTELTDDDLNWLATGFDAASFERYQETYPELTELFRNKRYREKLTADLFYNELLESGVFGEYKNGGIMVDGDLMPI